jgi:hypothetical protein
MSSISPQPYATSWLTPVAVTTGVVLALLLGSNVSTPNFGLVGVISIAFIVASIGLPWVFPPLSIALLGFAGRYEVPPYVVGMTDVAFWLLLGLLIVIAAVKRDRVSVRVGRSHPVLLLFAAFLVSVIVSMVPTFGSTYGSEKAFRVLFYGIGLFLVISVFLRTVSRIEMTLIGLIGLVNVFAAASLAITVATQGLMGVKRIAPPGGGPITLARMLGFAAIACIGIALYKSGRVRFLLLCNAVVLILMIFLTGSRAPALFIALVLLLFPVLATIGKRTRRQAKLIALFLGALAVAMVPLWQFADQLGFSFVNRFALLVQDDKGGSVYARVDYFDVSIGIIEKTGGAINGIGSWPLLVEGVDRRAYPHNVFLEVGVEQGLPGLILFLFFLTAVFLSGLRLLRSASTDRPTSLLTIVSMLSFFYAILIAQTSGDLYDNRYIWFYGGLMVACTAVGRPKQGSQGSPYDRAEGTQR